MTRTRVTMQAIADELGITKVSVSKALRGQDGVSDDLRRRIVEKARALGYVRKDNGSSAAVKHLGFIEPRKYFLESGDFFTQIYYHLLQRCSSKRIRLHLHVLSEEEETSPNAPFPFEQEAMDGIFIGGELERECLERLKTFRIPIIAIGFYDADNAIDSVIVDDYYNSNRITNQLARMGHTRIGFLGDHRCAMSALDRYFGFLKGLEENGLEYHPEWLISDIDEHGRSIVDYQLPQALPTAFICHSDFAAFNLRLKLEKLGMQIPQDMAIATFDNTERAAESGAVITLDVTGDRFAHAAIQRMLWRYSNIDAEHHRVILDAPLIVHSPGTQQIAETRGASRTPAT